MTVRLAIVLFALTAIAVLARADFGSTPIPRVFASPSNTSYFRLVPPMQLEHIYEDTVGFAYLASWPEDKLLYETKGWYSKTVLVSDDGNYLARRGMWPSRGSPPESTPAVVFYEQGVPTKTYFVSDLIDDLSSLEYSVSHYSWGGELHWRRDYAWNSEVQVTTVEDKVFRFDIETGAIVSCKFAQSGDLC